MHAIQRSYKEVIRSYKRAKLNAFNIHGNMQVNKNVLRM